MNWLTTFLTTVVEAIATALGRRDTTPAPPPQSPPAEPGFDDIERAEDARLAKLREQERATPQPVILPPPLPPRTPLASVPEDRAENGGAMGTTRRPADTGDDPYEAIEPEPSTRRP